MQQSAESGQRDTCRKLPSVRMLAQAPYVRLESVGEPFTATATSNVERHLVENCVYRHRTGSWVEHIRARPRKNGTCRGSSSWALSRKHVYLERCRILLVRLWRCGKETNGRAPCSLVSSDSFAFSRVRWLQPIREAVADVR